MVSGLLEKPGPTPGFPCLWSEKILLAVEKLSVFISR
jgi:hypothetical protein